VSATTTQEFHGKRVLITGGNSGIGRAAAEQFTRRGARVAVMGRDARTLAATRSALGAGAIAIQGDVSSLADLDRLVEETRTGLGGIDVLVISAGVCPIRPIDGVTEQFFDYVIGVNLKGAFFTLQKCTPLLTDGAAVVLVGSSAARKGLGGMSVYAASKAGLRSLARSFSAELLARRIRVNVLSLGLVRTPLVERLDVPPDIAVQLTENLRRLVPLQRDGETSEAVAALMFLASADSTYVVGADLQADGGLTTL
jgi:NAD(P)-dependent dehydrogenase (short-subunit alcohol dehydrogenase family)